MTEDPKAIAASLDSFEKKLLLDGADGWGSWMWETAMAMVRRGLGTRLTRINDERIFIDEIPADWPVTNPIQPSCDFLCALASMGLAGEDDGNLEPEASDEV